MKVVVPNRTLTTGDVTVLGERSVGGACTHMPVYLAGEPITLTPPIGAPFTVTVHQPDGTSLTRLLTAP